MALSVTQFVSEQQDALIEFLNWWEKMNAVNPDMFPMEMPDDNDGLWWEMFNSFKDSPDATKAYFEDIQ